MSTQRDYRPGERLTIQGDKYDWAVDRVGSEVRVTTKSWLGRPTDRAFALGHLTGVTLRSSNAPPVTLASVATAVRTAIDEAKSGRTNPERLASMMPKGLFIRLDESVGEGRSRETEMSFSLDGADAEQDLISMAREIADVTALGYQGVFVLPEVGIEVRLSRAPGPRLKPVHEWADSADRKDAASTGLAAAGLPPFEPRRLRSRYKVDEWDPGRRVVFRRPFSRWAFAIFPFALLLLVGPGIVVVGLATGRELNVMNTLILTVVSAAFGIPCLALFLGMLPRSVVVDWPTRTLSIRRWPRERTIPFDAIVGIEAHARFYESSGTDGGGSSMTYAGEVKAQVRSHADGAIQQMDLLETEHLQEPDRPKRDTFPLAVELAKALGVAHRTENYSFSKKKGGHVVPAAR